MGRIPARFIDDLLARVDIVDVIGERVPMKKAGRDWSACCPFHDERTPSFTVSPNKQFYHCFGCGAHGSAIGFLMNYDRLEFPDAVEAATGIRPPLPAHMAGLFDRDERVTRIENDADAIKSLILERRTV